MPLGCSSTPTRSARRTIFLALELRSSATPTDYGDLFSEIGRFCGLGVDGVFSDNPDIAVEARDDAIGEPRDR